MGIAGQPLSGELQFILTEAKRYQLVEVKLSGGAHVKWVRQFNEPNGMTRTEVYEANETYVDETLTLWRKDQSPDGTIGPGMVCLPFQFNLPPNCQTTHPRIRNKLTDIATILYSLKAKIVTGETFHIDPKIEIPLRVKKITDINLPHLILPTQQSQHTLIGCMCCSAGEMQFTANLPRTGCCAGEKFPLTVNVENSSSRRIRMRVRMKRRWTYEAAGDMLEENRILKVYNSPQIQPQSQYMWDVKELVVPNVVPTMEGCNIIKTEDSLEVAAVIPWDFNPSVDFPITIGNVPFREDLSPQLP